jgi:hypothetical protein
MPREGKGIQVLGVDEVQPFMLLVVKALLLFSAASDLPLLLLFKHSCTLYFIVIGTSAL